MDWKKGIHGMTARLRDPVSGLTHFIAVILSFFALGVLAWKTTHPLKPWHLATSVVFCSGMILLYSVSTLYHWLPLEEKGRLFMRRLDHIMIFVLIAATYTPFCLVPFRDSFGWAMFGAVWAIAVLGTAFKVFWINAPRWVSTLIYVGMGWIAIAGFEPMVRILEPGALFWLVAGGVLYSTGAAVYGFRRPDPFPSTFGFHEIFHIFVMLGSSAHFWAIYRYVTVYD